MIYVMSDIHGCYDEYIQMLEKLRFSEEDELYILGDAVDRGPKPVQVLQDMMNRPNIHPLLGNHDYIARDVLHKFDRELEEGRADTYLSSVALRSHMYWLRDGGLSTAKEFSDLSAGERRAVLGYLDSFSGYKKIAAAGRRYVLTHAGIHDFDEDRELDSYGEMDFICDRIDYNKRYYSDGTYLVTGHTPTFVIREDMSPLVYEHEGNIAIDCGCVFGGRLAAYCLDTLTAYYVESGIKGAGSVGVGFL